MGRVRLFAVRIPIETVIAADADLTYKHSDRGTALRAAEQHQLQAGLYSI